MRARAERELAGALTDHFAAEGAAILDRLSRSLTALTDGTDPEAVAAIVAPADAMTAALRESSAGPLGAVLEAAALHELGSFAPVERSAVGLWLKGRRPKPLPTSPAEMPPEWHVPMSVIRADVNANLGKLIDAPFWTDVALTTRRRIASAIRQGIRNEELIETVRERIDALFGPMTARQRARTIAQTEATAGLNMGAQVVRDHLETAGIIAGKEWMSAGDANCRPTHKAAHGQRRKVRAKFRVGSAWCMYPGDLSLPAGERINCRCGSLAVPTD